MEVSIQGMDAFHVAVLVPREYELIMRPSIMFVGLFAKPAAGVRTGRLGPSDLCI